MTPEAVAAGCAAAEVALEPEACARLARYVELLLDANQRTNLTRITEPGEVLEKHLLDALLGLPWLAGPLVDVGSGGGVPGLVIACVRPEWRVALVESTSRKASFLREAARELGLSGVEVHCARAEALGKGKLRETFRTVTLRAVSSVATCLELGLPLVEPGGGALLYRGSEPLDLEAAGRVSEQLGGGSLELAERALSDGAGRALLWAPKVAATPARFPRRDGVPAKRPLA